MPAATMTIRVDNSLKQEFTSASKNCDRSASQLLRDFMRSFIDSQNQEVAMSSAEEKYLERIELGLKSVREGRCMSITDLKSRLAAHRAITDRKHA